MAKVTIKTDTCKGCELCVNACPKKILRLSKGSLNKKGYHAAEVTDMDSCYRLRRMRHYVPGLCNNC